MSLDYSSYNSNVCFPRQKAHGLGPDGDCSLRFASQFETMVVTLMATTKATQNENCLHPMFPSTPMVGQ